MKVLVVYDHPRRSSFCGAVLDSLTEGLEAAGHEVEIADLHREGFDPRMLVEDEPIWRDRTQVYSDEIRAQQARVDRNQGLILLFPVWWWSFPAMTKGWVDRIWNQGWANGWARLKQEKAMLVGIAADDAESFARRGYDKSMETQLLSGILQYCGIENSSMHLLHDSLTSPEHRDELLARARQLGQEF